jgi:hypothetical protein
MNDCGSHRRADLGSGNVRLLERKVFKFFAPDVFMPVNPPVSAEKKPKVARLSSFATKTEPDAPAVTLRSASFVTEARSYGILENKQAADDAKTYAQKIACP